MSSVIRVRTVVRSGGGQIQDASRLFTQLGVDLEWTLISKDYRVLKYLISIKIPREPRVSL